MKDTLLAWKKRIALYVYASREGPGNRKGLLDILLKWKLDGKPPGSQRRGVPNELTSKDGNRKWAAGHNPETEP